MNVKADFNLRWTYLSKGIFSSVVAHVMVLRLNKEICVFRVTLSLKPSYLIHAFCFFHVFSKENKRPTGHDSLT